ncbi:MAG: hypothetical protein HYS45_02550 [Parcubacteria group bacterium]|nr:hypothetical protein [Parcubacteria group bacterium]
MAVRDLPEPGAEEPDEISDSGAAERVSQRYQNLRAQARARGLAEAAKSEVKRAATNAAKKWIFGLILANLPVLAVIVGIIAITIFITTMLPAGIFSPGALPPAA